MGTNYYAKFIPILTEEEKDEYKKSIDDIDEKKIVEVLDKIRKPKDFPEWLKNYVEDGLIHIGKKSCGWLFCFNPQCYVGYDKIPHKLYSEFTKEKIKEFLLNDKLLLYNEYDELIDKNEFIENFIDNVNPDDVFKTVKDFNSFYKGENLHGYYYYNNLIDYLRTLKGITFTENYYDFFSDGLRFSTSTEFC